MFEAASAGPPPPSLQEPEQPPQGANIIHININISLNLKGFSHEILDLLNRPRLKQKPFIVNFPKNPNATSSLILKQH